jgi:carbonic anhydrase
MCEDHPTPLAAVRPAFSVGRRKLLTVAAIGAGATIVSVLGVRPASAGTAKALMLSCMDYRLVDDLVAYMNGEGLKDDYDLVVLAGAAIGAVNEAFSEWHLTFWEHLDAAITLHHIQEVIVIDHRDCGAAKLALGAEAVDTPEKETAVHAEAIRELARQVKEKHPTLGFAGYLMGLDGTVEDIPV